MLDLSVLTDDQLIELLRAALTEAAARGQATIAATREIMLGQAEQIKIATAAAETEAARWRALERERVAKDATEAVRRKAEAVNAEANAARIKQAAADASAKQQKLDDAEKSWLKRAAELTNTHPSKISIGEVPSYKDSGQRVVINEGNNQYNREHMADWASKSNKTKTVATLVGHKTAITSLLAEYQEWAKDSKDYRWVFGSDYKWEDATNG